MDNENLDTIIKLMAQLVKDNAELKAEQHSEFGQVKHEIEGTRKAVFNLNSRLEAMGKTVDEHTSKLGNLENEFGRHELEEKKHGKWKERIIAIGVGLTLACSAFAALFQLVNK